MSDPATEPILARIQNKTSFKIRKEAYEELEAQIDKGNYSDLETLAPLFGGLLNESNIVVLQKVLDMLTKSLARDFIPHESFASISHSLVDNCIGQTKTTIKNAAVEALVAISSKDRSSCSIAALVQGLGAKSLRTSQESAAALHRLISECDFKQPPPTFVKSLAPALDHKDEKTRHMVMSCLGVVATRCGSDMVIGVLGPLISAQRMSALKQALAEPQALPSTATTSSDLASKVPEGPHSVEHVAPISAVVKRFTYDAFDDMEPQAVSLQKGWEKQFENSAWKVKNAFLTETTEAFVKASRIDKNSFPLQALLKALKAVVDGDLTVAVVGSALRLAATISLHCGYLGPQNSYKPFILSAINRLKERKFAVISNSIIFLEACVARSVHLPEFCEDAFALALAHKNIEVRTDFSRFLRNVWATMAVYNSVYFLRKTDGRASISVSKTLGGTLSPDTEYPFGESPTTNIDGDAYARREDELIAELCNETYPESIKMMADGTPLVGEKSPALQLASRMLREKTCQGCTFITSASVSVNSDDECTSFMSLLNMLSKLASDKAAEARLWGSRIYALCLIAHVSELCAICAEDGLADISSPFAQRYVSIMRSHLSEQEDRRRKDILSYANKVCTTIGRRDIFNILNEHADSDRLSSSAPYSGQVERKSIGSRQPPPSGNGSDQPAEKVKVMHSAPSQAPKAVAPPDRLLSPRRVQGSVRSTSAVAMRLSDRASSLAAAPSVRGSSEYYQSIGQHTSSQRSAIPPDHDGQHMQFSSKNSAALQAQYTLRQNNSSIRWIADPFNMEHPISASLLSDLYQNMLTIFPPSLVSQLFLKLRHDAPTKSGTQDLATVIGTQKSIFENVRLLTDLCKKEQSAPQKTVVYARDILMRYASLLLCDGFTSTSSPNTTQIRIALDFIDSVLTELIAEKVSFTQHDMEALYSVLLARMEQFSLSAIREAISSLCERIVYLASPTLSINFILYNVIGRGAKVIIKQIPTRMANLRLCLIIAQHFLQNNAPQDDSPAPLCDFNINIMSTVLDFYSQKTSSDNFVFTDGEISREFVGYRAMNGRALSLALTSSVLSLATDTYRVKAFKLLERTLSPRDLADLRSVLGRMPGAHIFTDRQSNIAETESVGPPSRNVPATTRADSKFRGFPSIGTTGADISRQRNTDTLSEIMTTPKSARSSTGKLRTHSANRFYSTHTVESNAGVGASGRIGSTIGTGEYSVRTLRGNRGVVAGSGTGAMQREERRSARTLSSRLDEGGDDMKTLRSMPPSGAVEAASAVTGQVTRVRNPVDTSFKTPKLRSLDEPIEDAGDSQLAHPTRELQYIETLENALSHEIDQIDNSTLILQYFITCFRNAHGTPAHSGLVTPTRTAKSNESATFSHGFSSQTILVFRLLAASRDVVRHYVLTEPFIVSRQRNESPHLDSMHYKKIFTIRLFALLTAEICATDGISTIPEAQAKTIIFDLVVYTCLLNHYRTAAPAELAQDESLSIAAQCCYSSLLIFLRKGDLTTILCSVLSLLTHASSCNLKGETLISIYAAAHISVDDTIANMFLNSGPQSRNDTLPLSSHYLIISLCRKLGHPFLQALLQACDARVSLATNIFKSSDLYNSGICCTVSPKGVIIMWKSLEEKYPVFITTVSNAAWPAQSLAGKRGLLPGIHTPEQASGINIEPVMLCIHLFLLRQFEMQSSKHGTESFENPHMQIIREYIRSAIKVAGEVIYLFLRRVPATSGNMLRKLIQECLSQK